MSKEKNQYLETGRTVGATCGRKKSRWQNWAIVKWIKKAGDWLTHCMLFRFIGWIFKKIDKLILHTFTTPPVCSEQMLETWQLDQASLVQQLLQMEQVGETLGATISKELKNRYQTLAQQEGYSAYKNEYDFIHRKSIQYNGYPKTIQVSQLEQIAMDYKLAENMAEFFIEHSDGATAQQEEQAFRANLNSIVLPMAPR